MKINVLATLPLCILLFSACTKLSRGELHFPKACKGCATQLEKDAKNIQGVYYAKFDTVKQVLAYKFDPNGFDENFMKRQLAFGKYSAQDTTAPPPLCCE
jgi:hypothetical protein